MQTAFLKSIEVVNEMKCMASYSVRLRRIVSPHRRATRRKHGRPSPYRHHSRLHDFSVANGEVVVQRRARIPCQLLALIRLACSSSPVALHTFEPRRAYSESPSARRPTAARIHFLFRSHIKPIPKAGIITDANT